ncbi:MAG: MerR family transcriptional regulator [Acidobacteriota bacterium]
MAKKRYYRIGEACKQLDIAPYVLRYWESEFPFLSPEKNKSGQRTYEDSELEVIRRIKELLYDEGYTIAGARKRLEAELAGDTDEGEGADVEASDDDELREALEAARRDAEQATARAREARLASEKAEARATAAEAELENLRAELDAAGGDDDGDRDDFDQDDVDHDEDGAVEAAMAARAELRRGIEEALDRARALLEHLSEPVVTS